MHLLDRRAVVRRTLIAASGSALLSVVAFLCFLHGSLRLTTTEIAIGMTVFWAVNFAFIGAVLGDITTRLRDPSLSLVQMLWSSTCVLLVANLMDENRDLLLMMQLLAMIFGIFHLTLRQFLWLTAYCSTGYGLIVVSALSRNPATFEPFQELLTWGVYTTVLIAFSVLGTDVSKLRGVLRSQTRELVEARDMAEVAGRAKADFLGMLSHEIRTPLNALIGIPDILEQATLEEEERHYITTSRRASAHLLSLVGSMLDLSRLEEGKVELEYTRFELSALFEDIAGLMEYNARENGLEFKAALPKDAPRYLIGDMSRLHDVLVQLLGNAIKFTRAGEVSLLVRLEEGSVDRKCRLAFTVRDTGIGISPDRQAAIFSPFGLGDASSTRTHAGAGLGLAICQHLLALMNSELSLHSEVGKGSDFSFVVELPIAEPGSASLARPTPRLSEAGYIAPPPIRLLAVDDSIDNRLLLTALLKRLNVTIELAEDGAEAVERFTHEKYDLVLMDIHMPVKDGVTATREMRAYEADAGATPTPIVALTADVGKAAESDAVAAGFDEFVFKPVSKQSLEKLLIAHFGEQALVA